MMFGEATPFPAETQILGDTSIRITELHFFLGRLSFAQAFGDWSECKLVIENLSFVMYTIWT
jgi:hypothetical protein